MLVGVRFDLSVICKLLGLLNLFLLLPFAFRYNRYFLRVIALLGNTLMVVLLLIHLIDLGYYKIVGRRISFELFTMGTALKPTLEMGLKDYKPELIIGLILVGLTSWFWWLLWKVIFRLVPPKMKPQKTVGFFFLAVYLCLLVIGGRGGLQAKPIVENAAFRNSDLVLGHLSLNAPFTVLHQFTQDQAQKINWLSDQEARTTTRNLINKVETAQFPREGYTFYRQSASGTPQKRQDQNIVFIIMESWPAHSVGILGSKYQDITPEFDQLAKKSRYYTRFFSNGTRSIQGIAANLLSVAALPDIALILSGFEQNKMFSLVDYLTQKGYDSLFLHGIYRGSFGMHEFARRVGYKRIIAQEDFPEYQKKSDGTWGIWDHIQFEFMVEEIERMKKPFFATMFSVSSHEPFVLPDERFNFYPDSVPDHKWLNTLRYTDWALGQFFQRAEKKEWFKNTLFIVTADHTLSGRADKTMDSARIPLLIYSPGGEIEPGVDNRVGFQVDLIPTLIDYLGLNVHHNSMGTSLFATQKTARFGLFNTGSTTWITDSIAYQFSDQKLLGAYDFEDDWAFKKKIIDLDTEKHKIHIKEYKAYLQSAQNALIFNTLLP